MKYLAFVLLLILGTACHTTQEATATGKTDQAIPIDRVMPLSLIDYIRQTPRGLKVRNGAGLFYIIDGVPIGRSYNQANAMVDVRDIASVEIEYSVAATANYGLRGPGAIAKITTKTHTKMLEQRRERLRAERDSK